MQVRACEGVFFVSPGCGVWFSCSWVHMNDRVPAMDVIIYARISADATGESLGVDRQTEECRRYCDARGWTVTEVIVDNDLSATTGVTRPGFERLLTSHPAAIVVWHTDRLVRLSTELERVIAMGVNVYAVQAGHIDLSTPAGRAVAKTVTAWAQYEGEQKSLRQKLEAEQRAARGKHWWARRPFGYERDGTLREDEASLMRQEYAEVLTGAFSLSAFARRRNQHGYLTSEGNPWRHQPVKQSLLAHRNAGVSTYHGEPVGKGEWAPMVDEPTFLAAQTILTNSSHKKRGTTGSKAASLLTGIAKCEKCGSTVTVAYGKARADGTRRKHYRCPQGHCRAFVDTADEYVSGFLVARLSNPDVQEILGAANGIDVGTLVARKTVLEGAIANLGEDRAMGLVDTGEFRRLRTKQNAEMAELEEAIMNATMPTSITSNVNLFQIESEWRDDAKYTFELRRALVDAFLDVTILCRAPGVHMFDPDEHMRVLFRGMS